MTRFLPVAIALMAFCAGCTESSKKDTPDGDKPGVKGSISTRESTAGRWQLMVAERDTENPFLLLQIEGEGEKGTVKIVDTVREKGEPLKLDVEKAEITKDGVNLTFGGNGNSISYVGKFNDGEVVGNLALAPIAVLPARLIATEAKSLKDAQPSPMLLKDSLRSVLGAEDPVASVQAFAKKHPDSPLTLLAFEALLANVTRLGKDHKGISEAELAPIAEQFEKQSGRWGERMERLARLKVGLALVRSRHLPEVALKTFDSLEKTLGDPKHPLQETIDQAKKAANQVVEAQKREEEVAAAGKVMTSGTEEEQKAALETLQKVQKDDPYDSLALYYLAKYAQKAKQTDEAIDWLSRLTAFPSLDGELQVRLAQQEKSFTPPAETLEEVWKEKHGNTEGLAEHLNGVFRDALFSFVKEKVPPRNADAGTANVLLELFTGSNCPPCVAADVATAGLERVFDRKDVTVLRYHEHIGHDQLCNADSESRFHEYYKGRATPTLLLNGGSVGSVGGPLPAAPFYFEQLKQIVSHALEDKKNATTLKIDLSAEATDGVLHLKASVTGLPEDSKGLRLRMVLAEEEIPFVASNGIRLHEMIVRSMPGTPEGIAVKEGKLEYEEELPLDKFRSQLVNYLASYEESHSITFTQKPLALEKLAFVAFVQYDDNRKPEERKKDAAKPEDGKSEASRPQDKAILQSASIPVSGMIAYAKEKAPEPPPEPKKAEKADSDAKAEKSE